MLTSVPVVWQYVLLGIGALVATVLVLWAYNRREKRRKHALQLAKLMNRWGLEWFDEAYEMYAVGDYSGLTWKVKEIVEAVRSDEAMVSKLWEVTKRVTAHTAENDPTKAAELRALLANESKPTPAAVAK
jgi:sulfite reductase beta subunit-like hemoprotein